MTLEQRNDAGMSLLLGGGAGMNGASGLMMLRTEILTNKLINLGIWPGLYAYAEGTIESASYALTDKFLNDYSLTETAAAATPSCGQTSGLAGEFIFGATSRSHPTWGLGGRM
jgi:hypothetical protein